ncbi:MAG TPA: cytochrome c [Opitutaceae bacterium]|jgi:hypothetical protein
MNFTPLAYVALAALLPGTPSRQSPQDLEIIGAPPRFVSWESIYRDVPRRALTMPSELGSGLLPVEAVMLSDLQHALGEDKATVVLARCSDGYLSIFPVEFMARDKPFLVLTINGLTPGRWPPPGMRDNPGPYLITESDALTPGVNEIRDISHKQPWSVVSLEFASEGDLIGQLGAAPPAARWLWINSCASCHAGPGNFPGGTKSGRTFAVLQADARARPDFIRHYVAAPRKVNPAAQMPDQPEDVGPALDALIAFLAAQPG